MRQVIRKIRPSSLLAAFTVLAMALPSASAAVFEFNPVMPVVGVDAPYDRLPAPPNGPEYYDPGHIYGLYGVQIKDGYGGQNAVDGLDAINTLNFNVDDVDTPITRVEVLLSLYHPHLNDLDITLQSPNGVTVPLIRGISQPNAPITSRPLGGGYQYAGNIGGQFGIYGSALTPITLVTQVDEDDLANGATIPYINDPEILDDDPTSITYLNTVPPGTYFAQGDLRLFNGLSGNGRANGVWRLKVVDQKQNNFITVIDPDTNLPTQEYVYYLQAVIYAQIIIHQQGGYKVWTGEGGNNNWSDADNWDPVNGAPTVAQPASVVFPNAATNLGNNYTPVNDINIPRNLRIADINLAAGAQSYNINLNNVTFYKRCRIQNNGGSNAITFTAGVTQSTGRIKLDVKAGDLTLTGPISGAGGIKKLGPGVAVLSSGAGTSTFTGTSVVDEGVLRLLTPTALGGAGGNTTIRSTGIIEVGNLGAIAEPLSLIGNGVGNGALHITNNQTWNGEIALNGAYSGVWVDVGTLTISDFNPIALNGATSFTILGPGGVTLAGADAVLPTKTALSVVGATFTTNVAQPNLGNLVLSDATLVGNGALSPMDLGGFLKVKGAVVSSGTSTMQNPLNFAGGTRVISVGSGTLTANGAITNGALTKTGGGILALEAVSAGLPVSVSQGVLAGSGEIGALSVARAGVLNPTQTFNVSQATFAAQSGFIVDAGGDQLVSTGNVALSGSDDGGIGGAVLQPYEGATGTIITGPNTGAFEGYPRTIDRGVTYTGGAVQLGAANGQLVWFDPNSYRVEESVGSFPVTVEWQGGVGTAGLRHYGGDAIRDYNLVNGLVDDSAAGAGNTRIYTVVVPQNYVDTGDVSTTLALVPFNGARIRTAGLTAPQGSFATLLIDDDDVSDQKACGFGTGLTVFLLLGGALMFGARLRRR